MESIYVFGHRNPDTDSVVSSMAYTALCNAMGNNEYVAARLGHLNDETAFLLDHFGFPSPLFIHTARTQIKDISFDHPPCLGLGVPVSHAWKVLLGDQHLNSVPVTYEDGRLWGMLTAGTIAENDMRSIIRPEVKDVPVYNLLGALEGRVINHEDDMFDKVSGEVVLAMPTSVDPLQNLKEGSIVICGQDEQVVERALAKKASCIILCQSNLAEKYRDQSCSTCMISTPCDAYRAARMLFLSIPVSRITSTERLVAFHLDDFLDDVRDAVLDSRYRSYPVLDEQDHVVGTLSRFHLLRPKRKRVVLMDHNEASQSVPGLEQAEIVAILDHHRLGDVQTGYPVFMRNEPVGSTTTIVATMFQENGLLPSPKLAGLMACAIISDTVMFKSPTSTPRDRRMAERLVRIAGLDLEELGKLVFSASQGGERTPEAMLMSDFKEFHIAGHTLGIGQITSLDAGRTLSRMDELIAAMHALQESKHYNMLLLMVTDVLREGTELLFLGGEDTIEQAFNVKITDPRHVYLSGVVSRKKQVVPALAMLWG